jgi:oxygen-independent coproporphyrinogen-3 oxidase
MKTNYKEIHLGGGTPTFFLLKFRRLNGIFSYAIRPQHEFSFEGHPNNTTHAHLQSFTIWDLGELVLVFKITQTKCKKAIHREQPFHNVAK